MDKFKIETPCFGRGDYEEVLSKANYHQNTAFINRGLIMKMMKEENLREKNKKVSREISNGRADKNL